MKWLFFGGALAVLSAWGCAHAQPSPVPVMANTVASCGAQSFTTGQPYVLTMDTTGKVCDTGAGGGYSPVVPTSSYAINTASATTVQLVAPVSGQKVYVASWDVIASGTTTVTLEYGTGTNCGTGTTALTGPYALTAQVGLAPSGGYGPMFIIPASNALCIVNGSAVQISGRVSYAQQ